MYFGSNLIGRTVKVAPWRSSNKLKDRLFRIIIVAHNPDFDGQTIDDAQCRFEDLSDGSVQVQPLSALVFVPDLSPPAYVEKK